MRTSMFDIRTSKKIISVWNFHWGGLATFAAIAIKLGIIYQNYLFTTGDKIFDIFEMIRRNSNDTNKGTNV